MQGSLKKDDEYARVSHPNSPKKMLQYLSYRILRYVYGALNIDEKKLIAQFGWKLRDERFKPN